jgi:hypothetical protein
VRIAAELDIEARPRHVFEVRRHDPRGASVERERRDHHAAVSNRHEIWLAGLVLLREERDGIGTIVGRHPAFMAQTWRPLSGGLSRVVAFLERRVLNLACRHGDHLPPAPTDPIPAHRRTARPAAPHPMLAKVSFGFMPVG